MSDWTWRPHRIVPLYERRPKHTAACILWTIDRWARAGDDRVDLARAALEELRDGEGADEINTSILATALNVYERADDDGHTPS